MKASCTPGSTPASPGSVHAGMGILHHNNFVRHQRWQTEVNLPTNPVPTLGTWELCPVCAVEKRGEKGGRAGSLRQTRSFQRGLTGESPPCKSWR